MTHDDLFRIVIRHPKDYRDYGGEVDRETALDGDFGPDCSMGCRYYVPLHGKFQYDWGVCANPKSHRVGWLTFEHQGCVEFEPSNEDNQGGK